MIHTSSHFLLRFIARQDWLRVGIRNRVLWKFCSPERITSHEFTTDFFEFKYRGNLNCYIDWVVYFFGAYEKQELSLLSNMAKTMHKPIFIDVGANVGQHSLYMSQYCEEVHAFEPYERVRKFLEEKVKLNEIQNIYIHGFGLSDTDGELEFFEPIGCNTGTGSFSSNRAYTNTSSLVLQVVNGDTYLKKISPPKVDIIKIDVEGFESNVIFGLTNTLNKFRPIVVMEFSKTTQVAFENLNKLISSFPPRYEVRHIVCDTSYYTFFNRPKYKLLPFDFEKSTGDIMFYPVEKDIFNT